MTELAEFLDRLFADGDVVFTAPPTRGRQQDPAAVALLRSAFEDCRREIAGPALPLRLDTALAAAELLRHACWFLLSHGEPPGQVEQSLEFRQPKDATDHLSGDLLLRYLPQVERRARAIDPSDPLSVGLRRILRTWPLSGVLSDVLDPPLVAPDFFGHSGLQMLYAERLARSERSAWMPTGKSREYCELVYADLGRRLPEEAVETDTEPRGDHGGS
jgi:hypothetical protein